MGKRFYRFTAGLVRAFSHRMKTEWEVPFEEGPCVFVVNYAGITGPLEMCAKFPLRDKCHPWMNEEILDRKKIPAYVRRDRWWKPGGFFAPVYNATVPYLAAWLLPPILKGIDIIPVYHDQRLMLTLRQSVRVLQKDEALVIFPEVPGRHDRINTGWLRLGDLWYRSGGRSLKMYPVHIDRKKHVFKIAAPVLYDPAKRFSDQEKNISDKLAKGLRGE